MSKLKEWLVSVVEKWYWKVKRSSFSVNKNQRPWFVFFGDVTERSCAEIVRWILACNEDHPEFKTLHLFINSAGGQPESAMAVVHAMKSSKIPVHTVGVGQVCSAALLILMGGAWRSVSKRTMLLSHQIHSTFRGKYHDIRETARYLTELHTSQVDYYKTCTQLPSEEIRKTLLGPTDCWMTSEKALWFNLIDEVYEEEFIPVQRVISREKV